MPSTWSGPLSGFVLCLALTSAALAQTAATLLPRNCLPEREAAAHNEATLALQRRYAGLRQGCAGRLAEACALEATVFFRLRAMMERPPCIGEFFLAPNELSPACSRLEAMRRVAEVAGAQVVTTLVRTALRDACMPEGSGLFAPWTQLSTEDVGWHYPNGQLFHAEGSSDWFYPDGNPLSLGGNWYYPNGVTLRNEAGDWRTPQGDVFAGVASFARVGCMREGSQEGPLCNEAYARLGRDRYLPGPVRESSPFWTALALLQLHYAVR